MNRQRNEFDEVGIRVGYISRRDGERPTLLQQHLREILQSAGDHQARVLKIESLGDGSRKIESFCHDHLTGRLRHVERYVVTKHTTMIIRLRMTSLLLHERGGTPEDLLRVKLTSKLRLANKPGRLAQDGLQRPTIDLPVIRNGEGLNVSFYKTPELNMAPALGIKIEPESTEDFNKLCADRLRSLVIRPPRRTPMLRELSDSP